LEQEGGESDREPAELNRSSAEVSHVSVQRFGTGEGEEHAAEHHESLPRVVSHEPDRVHRIPGLEYLRRSDDAQQAEQPDCREPEQHDGPEDGPDPAGSPMLYRE
jgi:hypothetical protein